MSTNTVVRLSPYTWRSNLKRDVPQEDHNTCKDTVSRGKFTSPETTGYCENLQHGSYLRLWTWLVAAHVRVELTEVALRSNSAGE